PPPPPPPARCSALLDAVVPRSPLRFFSLDRPVALISEIAETAACPKCEHDRAYYMMIQIRSADEPASIFYKVGVPFRFLLCGAFLLFSSAAPLRTPVPGYGPDTTFGFGFFFLKKIAVLQPGMRLPVEGEVTNRTWATDALDPALSSESRPRWLADTRERPGRGLQRDNDQAETAGTRSERGRWRAPAGAKLTLCPGGVSSSHRDPRSSGAGSPDHTPSSGVAAPSEMPVHGGGGDRGSGTPGPSSSATLGLELFGSVAALQSRSDHAKALDVLRRAAAQVKPEFYPKNPTLLGLNHNRGAKIQVRVRSPSDPAGFLPFDSVLGTLY
ncbi:MAG: hypothetical protein BJ554DRAFT_3100, partial [Olpidium bornovanus]